MSVDHCIKAYKGEVWLPGCQYTSYSDFERAKEECSNNIDRVKNKIRQICICTPKDVFPSDSEGDTLWKLNSEVDELFEELNEYEWEMCRINIIQTILDDWEYTGKKDPRKNWTKINPDLYEDLRKDMKKTIETFDGNPETIKKMEEENHKVCEELRKKLEEES